eukprot:6208552-Pyramimonas_sp.AAC.3
MHLPRSATASDRRTMPGLLHRLDVVLRECNPYVQDFMTAHEIFRDSDMRVEATFLINPDERPQGEHERRYDPMTGTRGLWPLETFGRSPYFIRMLARHRTARLPSNIERVVLKQCTRRVDLTTHCIFLC